LNAQQHLKPAELLLAHRHHRHGASPGTQNPGECHLNFAQGCHLYIARTTSPNYFREVWALRDVSFSIRRGETVGVIGRDGSGKSTLLQLVCGTLTPTTGTAKAVGRVGALLELGSGFNPEFTGIENVLMNASVLGLTRSETEARLDDILAFADVGEFVNQPLKTYSSGMAMRLAFAVIAHVDADLLIIDEARAVGDAYFQQKCLRWLKRFRDTGTVLFCGHDTNAVMNLCDWAIWLEKGEVQSIGTSKEVCEAYMASIYAQATGMRVTSLRPRQTPPHQAVVSPKSAIAPPPQSAQVFEFNEASASFGLGDARIIDMRLTRTDGSDLGYLEGGEEVRFTIRARAERELANPILGFHIKDRLGQPLIGDNTFLACPNQNMSLAPGDEVEARFVFELPFLRSGDYTVTAAIASGTLDNHVQHHWVHDALLFTVHSLLRNGMMIGVPMREIAMSVARQREPACSVEVQS
jgi:lipopolysaccharide transport system ATP-binding protein